jgi:hypothetical protein
MMDNTNFNEDMLDKIETAMVDYLYDLHKGIIWEAGGLDDDDSSDHNGEPQVKRHKGNHWDEEEMNDVPDEKDALMKSLYEEIRADTNKEKKSQSNYETIVENRRVKLSQSLKLQVSSYIRYCKEMDIMLVLEEYGNDDYRTNGRKKAIDIRKLSYYKDALYTNQYFDILLWWNVYGRNNYPLLMPGASIILGKPTHNAFQERVFSRGTYADSNLKKSMKENNFEMAVLNSLNCQKMDEIIKQQNMKVKKRNYNAHLTAFFNRKKSDDSDMVVEKSDVFGYNKYTIDDEIQDKSDESVDGDDLEEVASIISYDSDYDEFDLAHADDQEDSKESATDVYEDIIGDPDYLL